MRDICPRRGISVCFGTHRSVLRLVIKRRVLEAWCDVSVRKKKADVGGTWAPSLEEARCPSCRLLEGTLGISGGFRLVVYWHFFPYILHWVNRMK